MHWFYSRNQESRTGGKAKLISLLKTLVTEPVNLFIGLALVLLFLGLNMQSLPIVISDALSKLSLMMTPLVLLFIGLAVKIKKKQFLQILSLLLLRAGLVFLATALFVTIAGLKTPNDMLLMLSFGLSACSFWPFAHLSLVDGLELEKKSKTFDSNYAVAILALSFPLSTTLILGVLNSGPLLVPSLNIFFVGLTLLALGTTFPIVKLLSKKVSKLQLSDSPMEAPTAKRA